MWTFLARVGASLLNKVLPDRSGVNQAQARVNEAEVAGAPPSILRLWRGFLGWTCSLLFAWEVVGRLIIIPILFPEWGKTLPPSCIDHVTTLLAAMLGVGF